MNDRNVNEAVKKYKQVRITVEEERLIRFLRESSFNELIPGLIVAQQAILPVSETIWRELRELTFSLESAARMGNKELVECQKRAEEILKTLK